MNYLLKNRIFAETIFQYKTAAQRPLRFPSEAFFFSIPDAVRPDFIRLDFRHLTVR